jgi:O-glycosyl hydrolase
MKSKAIKAPCNFFLIVRMASLLAMATRMPCSAGTAAEPGLFQLPAWQAPADAGIVATLPARHQQRVFMDEFLPSLFSRTLVLEGAVAPKEELLWILTGPRAGVTVAIRPGEIELLSNHYDSYALHPEDALAGKVPPDRHGNRQRSLFKTSIQGNPAAVTLVLDHSAYVELLLNGLSVHRSTFAEDLSRHQIREGGSPPAWHILSPAGTQATVTIDPGKRHQRMLGWGGITSPNSYQLLSPAGKNQWWKLLAEYGLNIQREYPAGRTLKPDYSNLGSPDAAIHHYYADNFPNGETSDFDYLRRHRQLPDSAVWFEYWWQLPPWTEGNADAYAESIRVYCKRLQETSGRPPEIIGVQNEHLGANWSDQIQTLRRHLDTAGFKDTRIHMNDNGHICEGIDWLRQYRDNPVAWKLLDYTASHQYDFQACFTDPDRFDRTLRTWRELSAEKPYLSTELCVNDNAWQVRSYRLAFLMAQQYHKTLTIADAAAIAYCWLLLDTEQPSYLWTRSLWGVDKENGFAPAPTSHQLRCFGAYSRRIPPGMTRVAAESDMAELLVTTFTGENDKATVVMLNRSIAPLQVSINGLPTVLTTAERTSPFHPNAIDVDFVPSAPVHIAPGEIVTLTNVALGVMP